MGMLGSAYVQIAADMSAFKKGLSEGKSEVNSWLKYTNKQLAAFDMSPVIRNIGVLGLRIASITAPITITGGALYAIAQKTANVGDELYKLSQKTGLSVGELYSLKKAAELADTDMASLAVGIKTFAGNLEEAKQKQGEARDIFQALGVDYMQPINQAFVATAERLSAIESGAGRLNLATKLLGKSGMDLIPLLEDIADKGLEVSTTFTDEAAKAAQEFNDNLTSLKQNALEFAYSIGNRVIPVLNSLYEAFTKTSADKIVSQMQGAGNAISNLGIEIAQIRKNWDEANNLDTSALTNKLLAMVDASLNPIGELTKKINELQNVVDSVGVENAGKLTKQLDDLKKARAELYKKEFTDEAAPKEKSPEIVDTTKREQAYAKMYGAIKGQSKEWLAFEIAQLQKERDEFVKTTGDAELANQAFEERRKKSIEEFVKVRQESEGGQEIARFYDSMKQKNDEWVNYKFQRIEEEKAKYTALGIAEVQVEGWAADQRMAIINEFTASQQDANREEIEVANARRAAYADMYSALQYNTEHYYEYQKELLEKQREENIRITGDIALAWEAYYAKLQELEEQKTLRTNDFAGGIRVFYQQMERDGFTWAKASNEMMRDFASGAQSSITGLLKGIETDTKNIGQHLKNFVKDFAGMFLDAINKMIAQWLIMQAITGIGKAFGLGAGGGEMVDTNWGGSLLGGGNMVAHTGGLITEKGIKSYHTGGLNNKEVFAKVLKGEYVESLSGVRAAGIPALQAINNGNIGLAARILSKRAGGGEAVETEAATNYEVAPYRYPRFAFDLKTIQFPQPPQPALPAMKNPATGIPAKIPADMIGTLGKAAIPKLVLPEDSGDTERRNMPKMPSDFDPSYNFKTIPTFPADLKKTINKDVTTKPTGDTNTGALTTFTGTFSPRFDFGRKHISAPQPTLPMIKKGDVVTNNNKEVSTTNSDGGITVHMPLNFNFQAPMDAYSFSQYLNRSRGEIQKIVGDGVMRSQRYADQIRGKRHG